MNEYAVQKLDRKTWKGTALPVSYTSEYYYDISVNKTDEGFIIPVRKMKFDLPGGAYPFYS